MVHDEHKGFFSFTGYELVFFLFFVYSYLNIGVLVTRLFHVPVPINIIFFVITFALVFIKASFKFFPRYFIWVNIFMLLFAVGGLMGSRAVIGYESFQSVFKHWITNVGMPWLALLCIRKEHYRFYLKSLLILGGIGGVFSLVQIPFFTFFERIIGSSTVRTAGFWFNPNNAAMMLLSTLFITGGFKTNKKLLLWVLRILIIAGIITSFSRTAIVLLFIGALYYAFVLRKMKLVFGTLMVGFVFVVGIAVNISQFSEYQQKRILSVAQVASNDEVEADNRSALWVFAIIEVYENAPIIGLGHTSMDHVVPIATGLGPHNYFIWMWGNSGLLGLFGFFIFLFGLFRVGLKMKNRKVKAGVLILILTLFFYNVLAHDIMAHQMTGVLTTMIAISIYHFSEKEENEKITG